MSFSIDHAGVIQVSWKRWLLIEIPNSCVYLGAFKINNQVNDDTK